MEASRSIAIDLIHIHRPFLLLFATMAPCMALSLLLGFEAFFAAPRTVGVHVVSPQMYHSAFDPDFGDNNRERRAGLMAAYGTPGTAGRVAQTSNTYMPDNIGDSASQLRQPV